jgi:hypothetical protein
MVVKPMPGLYNTSSISRGRTVARFVSPAKPGARAGVAAAQSATVTAIAARSVRVNGHMLSISFGK